VIPTARRPESLRRLLAALPSALRGIEADVLVVDNDSAGSAQRVVQSAPAQSRYVVEPRAGSAHARNRGLAEVTTNVVAFLDDDVVPEPGWLAALLRPLGSGVVAVGGRVLLDPAVARPRWFDEAGIGGYLTAFDLGGAGRPLGHGEYVVTANAAFDAEALRSIGGFDPALGPRPGAQLVADDVHVVRALMAAGHQVAWAPEALVVHELPAQRLRRSWLLRRAYLQGRSDWLLDQVSLRQRRAGGARVALSWLRGELARRAAEGLSDPGTRFHAATDLARTLGAVGQGLRWRGARLDDPRT
jgi:GT2 family glycosyltransferase